MVEADIARLSTDDDAVVCAVARAVARIDVVMVESGFRRVLNVN